MREREVGQQYEEEKKKGNCPRVTKMKIIAKKKARDVVGEIIDVMTEKEAGCN